VSSVPTLKTFISTQPIQQTQKCRPNKSATQGGLHPLATPLKDLCYNLHVSVWFVCGNTMYMTSMSKNKTEIKFYFVGFFLSKLVLGLFFFIVFIFWQKREGYNINLCINFHYFKHVLLSNRQWISFSRRDYNYFYFK
jgi:hypothetical protein